MTDMTDQSGKTVPTDLNDSVDLNDSNLTNVPTDSETLPCTAGEVTNGTDPSGEAIGLYRAFLQEGREAALEALVRLYSDALVRYARGYVRDGAVAEEMAEEAFVALVLNRNHFRAEAQLRAYLYKVTRSRCIDHLRRAKRTVSLSGFEDLVTLRDGEENRGAGIDGALVYDPAEEELRDARRRAVRTCMEKLPPQYGEVLYLFYFEGLTFDALCEVMQRSRKQAYNLLSRARAAMRDELRKEGIEE